MSEFSRKILSLTKKIPRGKVTTYSALAAKTGYEGACRACGTVLKKNTSPITIPCHRGVLANGTVGDYVLGQQKKIALLKAEGVCVDKGYVKNFKQNLWT